jgi:ferrochelatase
VCPGFAVDCLETLEEISIENRELFMHAGGERYDYIPALNAGAAHARFMTDLIAQHCQGWTPAGQENLPATARGTSA